MSANSGNVNIYFSSRFENSRALINFNFSVVDEEFDDFRDEVSLP